MGASGYDSDTLKEYIPAMVYTLYDGYYIYGKYFDYDKVGSSGSSVGQYQYGLKPYIYYACRYVNGTDDFVVNYTLDNSITIYGRVNGNYITKSGYVVNPNLVQVNSSIKMSDSAVQSKLIAYNYINYDPSKIDYSRYTEIEYPTNVTYDTTVPIELETLTEQLVTYEDINDKDAYKNEITGENNYLVDLLADSNTLEAESVVLEDKPLDVNYGKPISAYVKAEYQYTFYNNQKIYKDNVLDKNGKIQYFLYNKNQKQYLSDNNKVITSEQYLDDDGNVKMRGEVTPLMFAIVMTDSSGNLQSNSGVEYYAKAKNFSTWLTTNLSGIDQSDARNNDGTVMQLAINTGTKKIFSFDATNNPLVEGSTFNEHRMAVIRQSIETNLHTAIANFNTGSGLVNEFQMPVLTEEDWDKLLNNVSLSVFMQGIPIKSKTFNSYCIVTNDKNEEVVTEDAIYIVEKKVSNGAVEMHMPGCKDLVDHCSGVDYQIVGAYSITDFQRQTITISQEDTYFYYPQYATRCYNCIVNVSANYDISNIIEGTIMKYNRTTGEDEPDHSKNISNLRKWYLTALGRTRYDLYRTNQNIE